jgi:hypothetical protein
MKKKLLIVPYFLLWILYFLFTIEQRNEYLISLNKGKKCVGSKDTSMFLYGSERTYYFSNEKPNRDYLTWKEFWQSKGY